MRKFWESLSLNDSFAWPSKCDFRRPARSQIPENVANGVWYETAQDFGLLLGASKDAAVESNSTPRGRVDWRKKQWPGLLWLKGERFGFRGEWKSAEEWRWKHVKSKSNSQKLCLTCFREGSGLRCETEAALSGERLKDLVVQFRVRLLLYIFGRDISALFILDNQERKSLPYKKIVACHVWDC